METTTERRPSRGVITGEEGGPIELDLAARWTANYRQRHPRGKGSISQFFGQKILNQILQQDGCLGLRIYYANSQPLSGFQRFFVAIGNFFIRTIANADGELKVVITGVTETGDDLLPGDDHKTNDAQPVMKTFMLQSQKVIGDQSMPCPGSAGCPSNTLSGY